MPLMLLRKMDLRRVLILSDYQLQLLLVVFISLELFRRKFLEKLKLFLQDLDISIENLESSLLASQQYMILFHMRTTDLRLVRL